MDFVCVCVCKIKCLHKNDVFLKEKYLRAHFRDMNVNAFGCF